MLRAVTVGPASAPLVAALSEEERGIALGALALGLGAAVADGLAGATARRCREVLEGAAGLASAEKAALVARLAHGVRATPFALDADQVHASWWRAVLAEEPAELLAALVAGAPPAARAVAEELARARGQGGAEPAPLPADVVGDLQRLIFADLFASPPAAVTPGSLAASLLLLGAEALLEEVRRAGATALGASLVGAPREVMARAMAGVGPRYAPVVQAAALAGAAPERRRLARKDVAAASAEPPSAGEDRLASIGASALGRELAEEPHGVRRALACRLPVAVGRGMLGAPPGEGGAG
jgi:hypothetical protein